MNIGIYNDEYKGERKGQRLYEIQADWWLMTYGNEMNMT